MYTRTRQDFTRGRLSCSLRMKSQRKSKWEKKSCSSLLDFVGDQKRNAKHGINNVLALGCAKLQVQNLEAVAVCVGFDP